MKFWKRAIPAAVMTIVVAAITCPVFATESTDLAVGGQIKPAACTLTLSDDGKINVGTIPASTLSASSATVIPTREFMLSINCDAAAMVGITTDDDRAGSASGTAGKAISAEKAHQFGLGMVDGKSIGAYKIRRTPSIGTMDNEQASQLYSDNGGASWSIPPTDTFARPGSGRIMSWGHTGQNVPALLQNMVQSFEIDIAVAPKKDLPGLTTDVPIDGLATFTLMYL